MQARQHLIDTNKLEFPPSTRRNPGRMDGSAWNGDSFICPDECDALQDLSEDEVLEELDHASPHTAPLRQTSIYVDILKIAKPAKRKGRPRGHTRINTSSSFGTGAAKNFEVLEPVGRVIVLEDEVDVKEDPDDLDLLSIYSDVDEVVPQRMSYSRAVQGQG
jgi:hypothetical protein